MHIHLKWVFLLCFLSSAASVFFTVGVVFSKPAVQFNYEVKTAKDILKIDMSYYKNMNDVHDYIVSNNMDKANYLLNWLCVNNYEIIEDLTLKLSSAPYNIVLQKDIDEANIFLKSNIDSYNSHKESLQKK